MQLNHHCVIHPGDARGAVPDGWVDGSREGRESYEAELAACIARGGAGEAEAEALAAEDAAFAGATPAGLCSAFVRRVSASWRSLVCVYSR